MGLKIILPAMLVLLLAAGLASAQQNATHARDSLANAEKDIEDMLKSGFGTAFVNDTLIEARNAFNKSDYALTLGKAGLISQRKSQAYNISDSIRAAWLGIEDLESAGLNSTIAVEFLNESAYAFNNERYEESERLVSRAYSEIANAKAEATLVGVMLRSAGDNLISSVKTNAAAIILALAAMIPVAYFALNRAAMIRAKNTAREMEIEMKVLVGLMKRAQSDHFEKGTMTRDTYEIRIKKFKERVIEIKRMLPVLRARAEDKMKRR